MSEPLMAVPGARGSGAPLGLPDLLRGRVLEDPDAPALVVDRGETLTYAAWERRSNATARGLVARAVSGGERIALLFDNARWTNYAVCYLAVHKAAAVAVPISPRFSPPELDHVLSHCDASMLVCPPDLVDMVRSVGISVLTTAEVEDGQGIDAFQRALAPSDLAEIIYTSGTTGTPKGVACSHSNLLFHELPADGGAAEERTSFLHSFPIGTNAGQEVLRLPLRRRGRTAVVLPSFDPERLCAAVAEHGVTRLQLVPAMAQMILDSGAYKRHDVTSIERVTLSSAPTPLPLLSRLADAFPKASISIAYALTESGTARTLLPDASARPGSVGKPVGGTELRVVDKEGKALPAGQTGEVWLRRRDAPRREYYRDLEATAAAFAGEWLRTGDLGWLDEEGYLYLVDRKKDLIISGGANISSVEIENVLYQHPAVVEAAVFGVPHPVLGQDVSAAVVTRTATTARELQAFVRDRLAEHKTPRRVVFVDHLPRNASGKVLKRELAGAGPGVPGGCRQGSEPRGSTHRVVAEVWREVLRCGNLGVHEDFFELGGHSLAAAQAAARLEEVFKVNLPLTAVFEFPTVAELAADIDRRLANDP